MGSMRFLLLLAVAVLLVHKGESLKCWACDSSPPGMNLRGCSDPFLGSADLKEDHIFIKDSELNHGLMQILPNGTTQFGTKFVDNGLEIVCVKITGRVLGEKYVVRGLAAGFPNITKGSCVPNLIGSRVQEMFGGTIETCDTCPSNLCNGAVVVGLTALPLVPLLLLLK